jgi:DAK2 domain fusion protein YloV
VLDVLDAAAVRRWCAAGREALAAARDEIDGLNVYPVPDGDTGTNLLLTMQSAEQALAQAPADLPGTARALAHGAFMGARGNSGMILSQLLRGLTEVLAGTEEPSAAEMRQGLQRAAELGYAAVATPVEGTLLTVARECAEAVAELDADLAGVVREARAAAARSLARTPELLPVLKAAGVVDAGGRGLCVLLEALERVVTGGCADDPQQGGPQQARQDATQLLVPRDRAALSSAREEGSAEFGYEVQFLLREATDAAVAELRQALARLGDSLVVIGADGLFHVHVHVNDVGAAVEAGVEAGRPFRITVVRFEDQSAEARPPAHPSAPPAARPEPRVGRAVVAVAPGEGLAGLIRSSGAEVVLGGPTSNASTAELLDAVHRAGRAEVVLLPNDANTTAVASAAASAARDEGYAAAVVPTRSVLQGLAALAVADPDRPFADDVAAMAEAAGSTRSAEVTVAVREAATMAGVCRAGDVLGLLEGDVLLIGEDVEQVGRELLDRMLIGGGELVTVVTGQDAPPGSGERMVEYVEAVRPLVEVVHYEGGQPHYPLLLGVE